MIRCFVQRFLNIGYVIGSEAGTATLGVPPLNQGPLLPVQRAALLQFLSTALLPELNVELGGTRGLTLSLIGDLQRISPLEQERVAEKLRNIRVVMQNELTARYCFFVSPERADFFTAPERFFLLSFSAFPSAQGEMLDACRSFACDLWNACVYHCIGVLERGLLVLAGHLKVSASGPLDLENWKNIIDMVEKKVKSLEQQPKGQAKDKEVKFLSEAAIQFRYFKDAYRNHVARHRVAYNGVTAHSVLLHVRDFMEALVGGGLAEHPEGRT